MHLGESDWIVSGLPETYSICTNLGLQHLIYLGVHTNACVFGKPEAMRNLYAAGFACYVARDLTDAITCYDPDNGLTPDQGTAQAVTDLERARIPTVHLEEEMRDAGVWDPACVIETVRLTPWGTRQRPYLFRDSLQVTLSNPWLPHATIRYALDGSPPTAESAIYEKPLTLSRTTSLQADAFQSNRRLTLPSTGYFALLPAAPPRPAVFIDEIAPMPRLYPYAHWYWHPRYIEDGSLRPAAVCW